MPFPDFFSSGALFLSPICAYFVIYMFTRRRTLGISFLEFPKDLTAHTPNERPIEVALCVDLGGGRFSRATKELSSQFAFFYDVALEAIIFRDLLDDQKINSRNYVALSEYLVVIYRRLPYYCISVNDATGFPHSSPRNSNLQQLLPTVWPLSYFRGPI